MITIKEEFLTDAKTQRAIKAGGYEVLALWLAMKRYAAEHLTDGFVPDEDMEVLPGAPKRVRKLLKCLVECGKISQDKSRGPGLVDEVEGGWQLHDYLDHSASREDILLRKEKARIKKQLQRDKQRQELETLRSKSKGVPRGQPEGRALGQPEGHHPGPSRARVTQPSPALSGSEDPDTPLPPTALQADARRILDGGAHAQTVRFARGDARTWAEVRLVVDAYAETHGAQDIRTDNDKRVRATLEWFAAGYTPNEVAEVVELARAHDFWRDKALAALLSDTGRLDDLRRSPSVPAVSEPSGIVLTDREARYYS